MAAKDQARLPEVYVEARSSLAKCQRIDECREWANKAEALASYARQAEDEALLNHAHRIRGRAIRRCGELLKQIEKGRGGRPKTGAGTDPSSRKAVAGRAGLSDRQRKQALRVANIDEEEFELAIESDSPPTADALAERGKQSKPRPPGFREATKGLGTIRRMAEFGEDVTPSTYARGLEPFEIQEAIRVARKAWKWLGRAIEQMEKRK